MNDCWGEETLGKLGGVKKGQELFPILAQICVKIERSPLSLLGKRNYEGSSLFWFYLLSVLYDEFFEAVRSNLYL